MNDEPTPATLELSHTHQRYRGVVSFEEGGVLFTGAPVPPEPIEVVGLPEQTFFVPFARVARVVFE